MSANLSVDAEELPARLQHELTRLGGAAVAHLLQRATAALARAKTNDAAPEADSASSSDDDERRWREAACVAEEAYARSWERLHCGPWKTIASAWRQAFAHAALLRALCLQHRGDLFECMKILDMCLMMAGPHALKQTHALIAQVEARLTEAHAASTSTQTNGQGKPIERPTKRARVLAPDEDEIQIRYPIKRLACPSLDDFRQQALLQSEPVIITGAMEHWPALGRDDPRRAWRNIDYFRHVAGWRTVPIEIGSSYLEDDWRQELMTVSEFIDQYLLPQSETAASASGGPVGYLAQHHLFEQIAVLARDIIVPDYCALRRSDDDDEQEEEEDIAVNAWFGPKGTVSPLHFDPKDNLLCQVVGAKYLRLYAPDESDKLYPVEGLLSNTSQVRVQDPDHDTFPQFRAAKYVECVLKEGEMLYIPPRYWHYVTSLSTSFSVSFWWT